MDEDKYKDALPFTFAYKAYKHVIVHHGDGDSFGSHPILDPIFSAALYAYDHIHNKMLHLVIGSPADGRIQPHGFAVVACGVRVRVCPRECECGCTCVCMCALALALPLMECM